MKIKVKKIAALFLSATVLFSAAGCVKKASNDEINQKQLNLTVWETQGTDYVFPKQPTENIVEKWLIDKTGVKIENAFGNGGSQWDSKLNLLVAGNNLPDLIHIGGGQGPVHLSALSEADLVWELTPEMIKKYAPNIWAKVPEVSWNKISINGKIYGIPYAYDPSIYNYFDKLRETLTSEELERLLSKKSYGSTVNCSATQYLVIRDDILKAIFPEAMDYEEANKLTAEKEGPIGDELVDIPIKNKDEFVKFMYDIKALNLAEDNKPVYATGYDGGDLWYTLTILGSEMMGYKGSNYISAWDTANNKMVVPIIESITKEALKLQNKMINDGVIEMESLVHTQAQFKSKAYNGQYAILQAASVGGLKELNNKLATAGKKFRYRPFYTMLENDPSYQTSVALSAQIGWQQVMGIFKTVDEEDVPQVLKWMDSMFTDEFEEILYWGPKEAELYDELQDGTRKFKDERFNKFFINNDKSALDPTETKGLSGQVYSSPIGAFVPMKFTNLNKWAPTVLNNVVSYTLEDTGYKFKPDSKYVKAVKQMPVSAAWSAIFSDNKDLQEFWEARNQWENNFKITLTAQNPEDFEQKWNTAYKYVVDNFNIDNMLNEMTKSALEDFEASK